MNIWTIKQHDEFKTWLKSQKTKTQSIVLDRLDRIKLHGHFGNSRDLNDGLFELKFKSGLRIYFTFEKGKVVIVLAGGIKNAQTKDIRKARRLID